LLNRQNNYVERSSVNDNAAKSFNILAVTSLNALHRSFRAQLKKKNSNVTAEIYDARLR